MTTFESQIKQKLKYSFSDCPTISNSDIQNFVLAAFKMKIMKHLAMLWLNSPLNKQQFHEHILFVKRELIQGKSNIEIIEV